MKDWGMVDWDGITDQSIKNELIELMKADMGQVETDGMTNREKADARLREMGTNRESVRKIGVLFTHAPALAEACKAGALSIDKAYKLFKGDGTAQVTTNICQDNKEALTRLAKKYHVTQKDIIAGAIRHFIDLIVVGELFGKDETITEALKAGLIFAGLSEKEEQEEQK
jgi:predicted transcriptional regulator